LEKWPRISKFGTPIEYFGKNDEGKRVKHTLKLIAFKTPLRQDFDRFLEPEFRLSPADVYQHYFN